MKSVIDDALPNKLGLPAMPKQIAHTSVDLPVPFAPMITFKFAPGVNSNESYVLQTQIKNKEENIFWSFLQKSQIKKMNFKCCAYLIIRE